MQDPVSCEVNGLLGDVQDLVDVIVFHAFLVEDEEECVLGGLGSVLFLDATERGKVDGLVEVDDAFVVINRPTICYKMKLRSTVQLRDMENSVTGVVFLSFSLLNN